MISLARTILSKPRILYLDEATAGIDPHTEAILQRGIAQLIEGRTAIVVIDQGVVADDGTHDELMRLGGIYYGSSTIGFNEPSAAEPVATDGVEPDRGATPAHS